MTTEKHAEQPGVSSPKSSAEQAGVQTLEEIARETVFLMFIDEQDQDAAMPTILAALTKASEIKDASTANTHVREMEPSWSDVKRFVQLATDAAWDKYAPNRHPTWMRTVGEDIAFHIAVTAAELACKALLSEHGISSPATSIPGEAEAREASTANTHVLQMALKACPWPEDVWPTTTEKAASLTEIISRLTKWCSTPTYAELRARLQNGERVEEYQAILRDYEALLRSPATSVPGEAEVPRPAPLPLRGEQEALDEKEAPPDHARTVLQKASYTFSDVKAAWVAGKQHEQRYGQSDGDAPDFYSWIKDRAPSVVNRNDGLEYTGVSYSKSVPASLRGEEEQEKTSGIPEADVVKNLRQLVVDSCEDDTAIRNLVRPILGDFKTDGDSYGVPTPVDLVEELVKIILCGNGGSSPAIRVSSPDSPAPSEKVSAAVRDAEREASKK